MVNNIQQAALLMTNLTALSREEPISSDIGTVVEFHNDGKRCMYSTVSRANSMGYIPFVSMATGGRRAFENLINMTANIAKTVFLQQSLSTTVNSLGNNVTQIVRGAVEMVPIIGNLTMYQIDQMRIKSIENQICQNSIYRGDRSYYANGVEVCSGAIDSYDADVAFMCMGGARFA